MLVVDGQMIVNDSYLFVNTMLLLVQCVVFVGCKYLVENAGMVIGLPYQR